MCALDVEERIARLRLARCRGIGPIAFQGLLRRYGTARRAIAMLPTLASDRLGQPPAIAEIEDELAALAGLGAVAMCLGEPGYPEALGHTPDPPPAIIARGDASLLARPGVALVGARNASGNGRSLARTMAAELAAAGLVVVSGLARGIDTAVHEGALAASGLTTAVIACGVDLAYPPDNAGLQERIAGQGCVVSERPLGAEARARDFPRRNRIIAGLCQGVVVIEAAPQSGSLITARLAAEQGREVMAVPGSPMDPRHRGTNQLLREGATLVENAADVLEALRPLVGKPRPRRQTASTGPTLPAPNADAAAAPTPGLEPILDRLGPEPIEIDELIRQTGLAPAEVQSALLDLELDGRLQRHAGNRVALGAG